jgi:hypothetical protein
MQYQIVLRGPLLPVQEALRREVAGCRNLADINTGALDPNRMEKSLTIAESTHSQRTSRGQFAEWVEPPSLDRCGNNQRFCGRLLLCLAIILWRLVPFVNHWLFRIGTIWNLEPPQGPLPPSVLDLFSPSLAVLCLPLLPRTH